MSGCGCLWRNVRGSEMYLKWNQSEVECAVNHSDNDHSKSQLIKPGVGKKPPPRRPAAAAAGVVVELTPTLVDNTAVAMAGRPQCMYTDRLLTSGYSRMLPCIVYQSWSVPMPG
ncbi:hypothetical protein J6590_005413 [Homalodisca vitripennis]|nr:hypothetical protein J6590_005413 [Homalodisca vitripennis]